MEILEHHVFNLRNFLRTPKEISKHVAILSKKTTLAGKPLYPNLQIAATRKQYKNTLIAMRRAISKGQFTFVPDINADTGRANFDSLCDLCGNRINDQCTKPQ